VESVLDSNKLMLHRPMNDAIVMLPAQVRRCANLEALDADYSSVQMFFCSSLGLLKGDWG
jgi:hypothetical protein